MKIREYEIEHLSARFRSEGNSRDHAVRTLEDNTRHAISDFHQTYVVHEKWHEKIRSTMYLWA